MLELQKVRWKNFLATGNEFNEITLNEHSNVLISGKNGSGKSTIMDAITFVLFGKPFRRINKPQLLNSVTNRNLVVEMELRTGKHSYKVIRGIRPAHFEIYKNGKFIEQDANNRDYQDEFERNVLKMNYKTFCQIVILGNANFTPFMELSASARRNIVEDLLDIKIFSVMNSLLKNRIQDNKTELLANEHELVLLKNTIELNEKHNTELKKTREKTIKQKMRQIVDTQKKVEKLFKQRDKISSQQKKHAEKYKKNDEIVKKIEQLKLIQTSLNKKIHAANDGKDFYTEHEHCPECEQVLLEDFKESKIAGYENIILFNEEKLLKLNETLSKNYEKAKEFEEIRQIIMNYNHDINKINMDINSYNHLISSIQKEINELQEEVIIKNDNGDEKKKLTERKKHKEKLLHEREIYNISSLLLKDNGIKTQIVKKYIPIMNGLINKHLDELGFFCQFELDDSFNETIKSRYRDEFSYSSFSEGEKMRINLALLFAWREIARMRNASSVNLLILDEIMDSSLDADGTEEFLEIIRKLSGNNNIIIISHKHDQIVDKFDSTIKFEKHKNFSKLIK